MDRRVKVELYEEIRREYEFGIGTIRGVARKLCVHRREVRLAVESAVPPAREVGLTRGTVRRAIAQQDGPGYQRDHPVEIALVQHRRLAADGLRLGLNGERILQDVREAGYTGSRSTFYRWLKWLRDELDPPPWSGRFETEPAEQCQFDWSPYRLSLGAALTPVVIYSLVLGYSRRAHFHVSLSEKLDAVLEGLEAGLWHFGGVCRSVLVDNARAMVLVHRRSQVRFNDAFLGLCVHYRLCPIPATPGHPQTKGKVENPFGTLEAGLLQGGAWNSLEHLIQDVADFETRREQRVHHTTRVAPAVRFLDEKDHLTPLPPGIVLGARTFLRHLNNDATLSFGGVRYCVPPDDATRHVRVRTERGAYLRVYNARGEMIVRHALRPSGSPLVPLPQELRAQQTRRASSLSCVIDRFRER